MLNLRDAAKAAKAFQQATQGNTAPEEEILRRAQLCLGCDARKMVRARFKDQASKMLGMMANRNKVNPKLKNSKCGVCQCSLMLLIPARSEDLHRDSPQQAVDRKEANEQCLICLRHDALL